MRTGHALSVVAPLIHAFLFIAMWALYAIFNQGLSEGLSALIFAILMIVDLPFSIIAFGVMFGGGKDGTIAVVAWGIGCTLWWHLLGRGIDALGRRRRSQGT